MSRLTTRLVLSLAMCLVIGAPVLAEEGGAPEVNTGNDPRDFSSKFMPYYRYIELENGAKIRDFSVFGMWALSTKFALTYEFPLAREFDIRDTAACDTDPCFGEVPGEWPFTPPGIIAEGDGIEVGLGDTIVRIFASPDWQLFGGAFLPGVQFTVPTAVDEVLGNETFSGGPIFTHVWDNKLWPAPGSFFAMMNIFEFDIHKDSDREDVSIFMGRWFLQLPMNKKYKLYILTEFQPIYDFETDNFSFWFGPEFGKAFAPGKGIWRNGGALYFKPGLGIDPKESAGDRDWTMEVGFRYFFPAPRETYSMLPQGKPGR